MKRRKEKKYLLQVIFKSSSDRRMKSITGKVLKAVEEIVGQPPVSATIIKEPYAVSVQMTKPIFYKYPDGKPPLSGLLAFPEE